MEGANLLQAVSDAYRNLGSLRVEALISSESFDDGCRSYNEQRVRFAYTAPNQVRLEHPRRPSRLTISDGHNLHTFFDRLGPNNEGRYSKVPVPERKNLPGMFQAEYPYAQGQQAFLFDRIGERVASTEIRQSEVLLIDGKRVHCDLISVTHEPPEHRGLVLAASPFTFWVDQQTRLIMRQEGEVTIKTPHDDARTTKSSVTLTRFSIDQPISPEMFSFSPPKGAMDISPRGASDASSAAGAAVGSVGATAKNRLRAGARITGMEALWSSTPLGLSTGMRSSFRGVSLCLMTKNACKSPSAASVRRRKPSGLSRFQLVDH
jgi:outer membrane lipoprotein-sorting protein